MILHRINPFIYSRAVLPNEFVGREPELRRLFSRLATGQSTAVIGLPHVGKTSLLNYIMDPHMRRLQFGEEFDQDVFRILDAHMLRSVRSQAEFWEHALQPFEVDTPACLQPLRPVYAMAKENEFGTFVLEQLFSEVKERGVRYMLFLDEFDDLLSHPVLNSAEFYGSLRSLASRSLGLVLVLGSRRDVEQLNTLTQTINPHGSPYFNVFTQITLKSLSDQAAGCLLERAGERFQAADRAYVLAVSGYFPFLIQAAAAKLWEASEDGLGGVERYEYAGSELYNEARQHFSDTWRVWTNEMRRAVTLVALSQFPHLVENRQFAIQDDLQSLYDYSPELKTLQDLGVLDQIESGWRVSQGAFLWWLADELKRNARTVVDFQSWLHAQELDGILTTQQKEQLAHTTNSVMASLGKGATTLIESFAKGAVSAAFKGMGLG